MRDESQYRAARTTSLHDNCTGVHNSGIDPSCASHLPREFDALTQINVDFAFRVVVVRLFI
jgi:hypothetical protein